MTVALVLAEACICSSRVITIPLEVGADYRCESLSPNDDDDDAPSRAQP